MFSLNKSMQSLSVEYVLLHIHINVFHLYSKHMLCSCCELDTTTASKTVTLQLITSIKYRLEINNFDFTSFAEMSILTKFSMLAAVVCVYIWLINDLSIAHIVKRTFSKPSLIAHDKIKWKEKIIARTKIQQETVYSCRQFWELILLHI